MTKLLALDPGGTTGWSFWQYSPVTPLTLIEYGQAPNGAPGLRDFILAFNKTVDEVVAETFVLDGRTQFPDITSKRCEGVLDVLFPDWIGQRNTYKAHADDLLLKRHGWWFKGMDHARDSARHAVALLKTRKHMPTLRMLYPRQERTAA